MSSLVRPVTTVFSWLGSVADSTWRFSRLVWYNAMASNERVVLNIDSEGGEDPSGKHRPADAVACDMQRFMLNLKGAFMDENGRGVDYAAIKGSSDYAEYKEKCKELRCVDISSLAKDERMAFFLNVYNALTLHGLADKEQLPNSVLEVRNFWSLTCYDIGGHIFSLDDIEHGILRSNKPHPASKKSQFEEGDQRLQLKMEEVDPRLHFALVCGAKSCPPINVYGVKNLNFGLSAAARNFIQSDVQVVDGQVMLSKIFDWYGSDFGPTAEKVVEWCYEYMSDEQKEEVSRALAAADGKVSYSNYNWQLNSK